jgi:hypothetical protein
MLTCSYPQIGHPRVRGHQLDGGVQRLLVLHHISVHRDARDDRLPGQARVPVLLQRVPSVQAAQAGRGGVAALREGVHLLRAYQDLLHAARAVLLLRHPVLDPLQRGDVSPPFIPSYAHPPISSSVHPFIPLYVHPFIPSLPLCLCLRLHLHLCLLSSCLTHFIRSSALRSAQIN